MPEVFLSLGSLVLPGSMIAATWANSCFPTSVTCAKEYKKPKERKKIVPKGEKMESTMFFKGLMVGKRAGHKLYGSLCVTGMTPPGTMLPNIEHATLLADSSWWWPQLPAAQAPQQAARRLLRFVNVSTFRLANA